MSEFIYPPTLEVLQAFVGDANPREPRTIRTCVRRWYALRELCNNFSDRLFTDVDWRKSLFKEEPTSWDAKPNLVDGCISTKTVKNIIEDEGTSWSKWQQEYLNIYRRDNNSTFNQKLETNLAKIEVFQPFNSTLKTIHNDLEYFCNEGYLIFEGSKVDEVFSHIKNPLYRVTDDDRFPKLSRVGRLESATIAPFIDRDRSIDSGLSEDFQFFADRFWSASQPFQRFYIHSDYEVKTDIAANIDRYRGQLAEIWSGEKGFPCKLLYHSASKGKAYTAIIYPVCIYYYQRAFYVCAYGCQDDESTSSWYNYRLDRFQDLACLDWQSSLIPEDLRSKCEFEDDGDLIDEIGDELRKAYGFDIGLPQQTMLLRFEGDFHDRYIKHTWRHNSFKRIEIERIAEIFKLDRPEYTQIKSRIDRYRHDAYYTMNYRVGDNSVIMRLRAWCPNVEVLLPLELRERMREDIEQTWDLYRLARF
jgi:CRISPR-associated protein (TIGR03985 family)